MKVLQLVSNWKWAGTAEPMLVLSSALRARGHQVDLVCPEPPIGAPRSLWQEASLRNFDPIHPIERIRSALVWGDGERARRLAEWLETDALGGPYDIVHCWHARDHVLAARALGLGGLLERPDRKIRIVRFLSRSELVREWPWNRWLFGPGCDGLLCVNEAATTNARAIRGDRLVATHPGSIDLDRLGTRHDPAQVKRALGLSVSAQLIGVPTRIRRQSRPEILLSALSELIRTYPETRLVFMGGGKRSTRRVRELARAMGLERYVVFAGDHQEDHADLLAAMDVCTFLVPGSDGTCRTLMQSAALGRPMVGTRRGAIPEIISNGQTGLLVEENAQALASGWRRLLDNPVERREMGEAARRDALQRFRPDKHAAWMERFYERLRVSS